MTDLKDHAQKIERIVQALTAEGIGRDVAVSTALLRYPVPSTTGVDAELAALRTKDGGVRPELDPIPELADCESVHFTLMFVAERDPPDDLVSLTATQRGYGAGSWLYAGELGKREARTAVRFLRAQQQMRLVIGSITRYGTLHRFDVTTRGPGTYYIMEFKLADDRKLATATVSVSNGGRPIGDFPVPQQPRLVSLKRARALWELLRDIEALDISDYEDPADYMKAVDHRAQKRDQYLSGGHLIVVSDQTREMTAEENAGVVGDAIRDVCMDAAARTSERDAAIDQRDTLIDREAQMRAACIDAIGPVSSGSTLDLVRDLAKTYKTARADLAEEAAKLGRVVIGRARILAELEAAKRDLAVMTIARGSAVDTIRALEAKLEAVRGAAS